MKSISSCSSEFNIGCDPTIYEDKEEEDEEDGRDGIAKCENVVTEDDDAEGVVNVSRIRISIFPNSFLPCPSDPVPQK